MKKAYWIAKYKKIDDQDALGRYSEKAKKVTLGLAIVGLVLLVIGFFQQKDFVLLLPVAIQR